MERALKKFSWETSRSTLLPIGQVVLLPLEAANLAGLFGQGEIEGFSEFECQRGYYTW